MNLDDLIKPHALDHSRHDELIKRVAENMELVYNHFTIAMNAYYKIPNRNFKGGYLESDIDLLQMFYDHQKYGNVKDYHIVPPDESLLYLFEMKTHDTSSQYKKALNQLSKSKHMLMDYTPYQNIKCIYAFWTGNLENIRVEEIE